MSRGQMRSGQLRSGHRKRVGLALGGGVARGMAHIGVLSALVEGGIPVDYVTGTSSGAIVAASYCAGMSIEQIKEQAIRFRWRRIAHLVWPSRGFVSFDKLAHWMVKELGDLRFSDLHIPCVVVATDLEVGKPVPLTEGRLALAVQASCSVPGFVTPIRLNGMLLGDGGILDMLPVTVLREMGADYIIGVDVFSFSTRRSWGPFRYGLAAIEMLLEHSGGGVDQVDCLIKPDLENKTYLRFSKRLELIELGRQATLNKLDCIREDLAILEAT